MSLFISSLNSGSNGNCYYIGNQHEAVLIDAGITCKEIEVRMKRLGLSMQKVKAVFISHEHSDHISGVCVLSKKYQLPVYITPSTHLQGKIKLENHLIYYFSSYQPVTIGDLAIVGFPKFHDAADPYSFTVCCNNIKVGVFTDIGKPCKHLINHFKECNAAFLESNYDDTMLEQGRYPYFLKTRIRSGNGHLSNVQALNLFKIHKPKCMSHLVLSHLSKNNNCPKLVKNLFEEYAAGVKIIIASRDNETEVYHIHGADNINVSYRQQLLSSQLSFAFA